MKSATQQALLRHERQVERERAARLLSDSGNGAAAAPSGCPPSLGGSDASSNRSTASEQAVMKEVQTLYANHEEYGLKEGQTIKCVAYAWSSI